jgi:GNAT superfamily N-acetyltransferase
MTTVDIGWRQPFSSREANRLHAEAFNARLYDDQEWDWVKLVEEHSLFANVLTDGFVHAWLQDVMVSPEHQRGGIGAQLIEEAVSQSRQAGCEWLHVDFDDDVADFYYRRCGFQRTNGGLLYLQ